MKIMIAGRKFGQVAGGVERMAIALGNEMAARGHDIALLTWDAADAKTFYDLDPRIAWHRLAMGDPAVKAGWPLRLARAKRVRALLKAEKLDALIAFQDGPFISMRLFGAGLPIPMIAAERNAPSRFTHTRAYPPPLVSFAMLRLARTITIQCESYRRAYPAFLRSRIVTIPNPVFPAQGFADPGGGAGRRTLLCVGRLSYQKNQKVLIEAFARLAAEYPQWDLVLAGDGEDEAALKKLVAAFRLHDRIVFKGAVRDVASLYKSAHLFCLPSRWEGFPNALAEALAHGLPAAGYAGCDGVSDLITPDVNGRLAAGNGDFASLTNTLRGLMKDDAARADMGCAAVQSMAPYAPARVFDKWEELFRSCARS